MRICTFQISVKVWVEHSIIYFLFLPHFFVLSIFFLLSSIFSAQWRSGEQGIEKRSKRVTKGLKIADANTPHPNQK